MNTCLSSTHRVNGRIHGRVADNCVEVDAATWHGALTLREHDWSSEPSTATLEDVGARALEYARHLLRDTQRPSNLELAAQDDATLLRRLSTTAAP